MASPRAQMRLMQIRIQQLSKRAMDISQTKEQLIKNWDHQQIREHISKIELPFLHAVQDNVKQALESALPSHIKSTLTPFAQQLEHIETIVQQELKAPTQKQFLNYYEQEQQRASQMYDQSLTLLHQSPKQVRRHIQFSHRSGHSFIEVFGSLAVAFAICWWIWGGDSSRGNPVETLAYGDSPIATSGDTSGQVAISETRLKDITVYFVRQGTVYAHDNEQIAYRIPAGQAFIAKSYRHHHHATQVRIETRNGDYWAQYHDVVFVKSTSRTIYVTVDALNVRALPGSQYSVVGKLARGDRIQITGFHAPDKQTMWHRIMYNGKEAFIAAQWQEKWYVSGTPPTDWKTTDLTNDSDHVLLARMLFGEAKTCSKKEKIAIAYTVLNRIKNHRNHYGTPTVKGIILHDKAYSCFNRNDPNLTLLMDPMSHNPQQWQECLQVARLVLSGQVADPIGATHYHWTGSKAIWASASRQKSGEVTKLGVIDKHVFYKENIIH